MKSHIIGKRVPYSMYFQVEGKAGEIKTVAESPLSNRSDGRLFLFRPYDLNAEDGSPWDSSIHWAQPRHGALDVVDKCKSIIEKMEISGKKEVLQYYPRFPTKTIWFHSNRLSRGINFGSIHPRSKVIFTIKFIEDCKWTGWLVGDGVEVENKGVYAITPTSPCKRSFDQDVLEPKISTYHYDYVNKDGSSRWQFSYINNNERCEQCWFTYAEHEKWPWRQYEKFVNVDLDSQQTQDLVVESSGALFVEGVDVVTSMKEPIYTHIDDFRGSDLFLADMMKKLNSSSSNGLVTSKSFHLHGQLLVPNDDALVFRVTNVTNEPKKFYGKVKGYEMVEI